ncbi:cysteine-rich VLP protein [Methanosarcina sp. UBA5]|uniref:cysteine-rich VLP protein n=1 Tax=Methanosarcina sp. UBA5 TaxID=1915593 RepID=UPI0025FC6A0F|nr:cysteine-rich VLP protein [Methanosarcina sp. UBA5]
MALENDMTTEQSRKVTSLIRNECCNFDNGNCVLLDNGAYHKCTQVSNRELGCDWFLEAVLPLNQVLESEVLHFDSGLNIVQKKCTVCGKSITVQSNRAQYCPKCLIKVKKAQNKARQQKHRADSKMH